mgnify:CR=1 FL=1
MMSKEEMVENQPRSKARTILLGLLVLFFVAMAFLVFSVARLVNTVNEGATSAIEPIGDRVRSLFVPATPVILPNPATVVKQINDLSRLETASYEMEKVVTADSEQDGFLGMLLGESMIFIAYGKVYAGVDFARMQAADLVVVDPDTVMVHLPPAEIFTDIPVLDNERSFVADRDTGLLTRADPALETQVRQAAEQAIREAAQSSDILDRANVNAQTYMNNFLAGLGFTEIIFTPDTPPAAAPYQQEVPKGYYLLPTATPVAP